MNLNDWARNEIELACKKERGSKDISEFDYGVACYESAYKAFQSLLKDEHSGLSIIFTQQILNRLIEHKPLTPYGERVDINKFFKESSTGFIEINQEEYENRINDRIKDIELKPCPKCGYFPRLNYACGEFFMIGKRDFPVCGGFKEIHATEEQELEAWNRRADNG